MRIAIPVVFVLAALTSTQASAYCICDTTQLNTMISSRVIPLLQQINSGITQVNSNLQQLISQAKQIQADTNQTRSAVAELTSQSQALADYQVSENLNTAQKQSAADADVQAARSTIGSKHPAACEMAHDAENVARGSYSQAYASKVLTAQARADIQRTTNPVKETARINSLQDRDLVPEFVGSDSGTLNDDQVDSYMKFLTVLMPTPPRVPASLPERYKATPKAKEYEAEFKKLEATQLFYEKPFIREATMMFPSIEFTPEMSRIWSQVTNGVPQPPELQVTPDGAHSNFPNQWSSMVPTVRSGKPYISERDYLRYEVFKRYANPHYQSDPQYGLASMPTTETLLKELITVENLQNRMLYEMMNSELHGKQLAGAEGSWAVDHRYKDRLSTLENDLMRN